MSSEDEADNNRENIRDIKKQIEEKASDGAYVYRGQSGICRPKSDDDGTFPQVTSTLYRALYRKMEKCYDNDALREWRNMEHDMNFAQEGVLESAREFAIEDYNKDIDNDKDNEKILSYIQHYSGDTNFIDFTKDYHIALFFACSHKYSETGGEDGEVFLLKTSRLKDSEIKMINSNHPDHRVVAQKSVFLQSRTGFIPVKDLMKVVKIPRALKLPILRYLKDNHDVSLPTIYKDLHGYIRSSKEHGDAAMELYLGLDYNYQYNNAQSPEKKRDAAEKAIEHYDKAILLNPKYARAYCNRANARKALGLEGAIGDYERAIKDYKEAIDLKHDYAEAYYGLGLAWEMLGNIENLHKALSNLKEAKKLALDQNKQNMADNVQKNIKNIIMKISDL